MRVFHQLQIAHSALFRAADRRTRRDCGLTTSQVAVLQLLRQHDGQPITDLAASLSLGKSSLTGLIDRLGQLGLVRRAATPQDGRVSLIYLEPEGRALAETAGRAARGYNAALLAPFSTQEQAVIARFLAHLGENAEHIINGAGAKT